jgi:hypothetical protein
MRVNPFSVNTVQNNKRANSQPLSPSLKGAEAAAVRFQDAFYKAKMRPDATEFTKMRDIMVHNKNDRNVVEAAKNAAKDQSKAGEFVKSFMKAIGLAS